MNSIIQFLRKNPFRREIMLVIVLKLAALFLLWDLCFSNADKSLLEKMNLVSHFLKS